MNNKYLRPEHFESARKLVARMTLDEKIGQLTLREHYRSERDSELIAQGKVGNVFTVCGREVANSIQKIAVEKTRLGIPMFIGFDVIHGSRTVFPIPLATAASWDLERIEKAETVAAMEAWAQGINWIYAPMVDISREPRWGRIAEGAGEDQFLGSAIAQARVRGFQATNPKTGYPYSAACFKHYCGYGLSEAGRDYDTTDISERTLYSDYMKTYQAAVEAGAMSAMSSFNSLNGEPVSGSYHYLTEVLREQYGFEGFVASDYNAILELVNHRVAKDEKDAARIGILAGNDMDMTAGIYLKYLAELAEENPKILEKIDESVTRVLAVKYAVGLFDHPYISEEEADGCVLAPESVALARDVARHSCVLLKNENRTLPLKTGKKYLAVGALAENAVDQMGMWNTNGSADDVTTPLAALYAKEGIEVTFCKGYDFDQNEPSLSDGIEKLASEADEILFFCGEPAAWSGENNNRAHVDVPVEQIAVLRRLKASGKPVTSVLMTGRPIVCTELEKYSDAILCSWHAGIQSGPAICDILFGDFSPCGKLPVTFPRDGGQIPIYYARLTSGRPQWRVYKDMEKTPLYPFGHGLSYADISFEDRKVDREAVKENDTVKASVTVRNASAFDAYQVVQCYFEDMVSTYATPERRLCGFEKVLVPANGSVTVDFSIPVKRFAMMTPKLEEVVEPGEFRLYLGTDSTETEFVSVFVD